MSTCATRSFFVFLSPPCGAGMIFFSFYRRRAAREQYFYPFIVSVRRGNNIFLFLSSPCGAGTIFFSFYRLRAAREQYFSLFIVFVRRGNNIFSFYRLRAAREQFFLRLAAIFYSKKRKWRYVIAGTHGRCIPAIGIDFYFFQASIMALKSTGFSEAPPIKPPSMLGLAKSSPAFDALQLPP